MIDFDELVAAANSDSEFLLCARLGRSTPFRH
jgi:hypothetical protein